MSEPGRPSFDPLLAAIVGLVTCVVLLLMTATESEEPCTPVFPPCAYEDGNPNGQPCMWTDPDTGIRYFVDSSEYLN